MKNKGFLFRLLPLFAACLILLCTCNGNGGGKTVRIISWNLQTFFDAQTAGTEYADFKGAKSPWNREKYEARLDKLAAFIKENPADIYVFQETENEAVLQDIANRCAGTAFLPQKPLYVCFAGETGSALGIGVLSRLPMENVKIHRTDIRAVRGNGIKNGSDILPVLQPPLRPLLELGLQSGKKTFTLFACHWKSKSGGEQASDMWRSVQEKVLAERIDFLNRETEKMPVIACGDFNRALEEFNRRTEGQSLCFSAGEKAVELFSAWIEFSDTREPDSRLQKKVHTDLSRGSYYFKGKWEKIDHFFYNGFVNAVRFYAMSTGAYTDDKGIPKRYNPHTGSGYSDHLPLLFEFSIQ
ncbi:endonuclease/exonuclease/phosphatase family protein [Treponema sp. HNW]|uniref:endonuclease/exonuclease/phosphatase family protein n=1 Tax=Treponema sp. HNW TaxID=3116654 RepID=UPI003D12A423